ncbi:MAG: hypothetical protein WDM85_00545 [Caulobacteraceae bacterium]
MEAKLTRELVAFVQSLREIELRKVPSISETVRLGPRAGAAARRCALDRRRPRNPERAAEVRAGHRRGRAQAERSAGPRLRGQPSRSSSRRCGPPR